MSRTTDLMVNIYGNDKSASKTLKGVGKEADNAGEQFKRMGKVAATAFLAVGAAAGAFALSAAKAAAQDEKSQKMLAASIKNTTNATDAQIKSTEDFISKMQLTYGVADDKLRPAFATLSRATGDLGESQNLMQTAMDVSAGTGKDLTTVSLALAKAHNGNIGALTRLGIPLDKSIIKNKDFNAALAVLTKTFNGAAKAGADTFAGRMAIVQENLKEAKEQIGYALMPTLETMATYLTDTVVPNVQAFVDGLTGVKDKSDGAMTSIYNLGEKTRGFFKFLSDNKGMLEAIGIAIGAIFIGAKATAAVNAMVAAVGLLIPAFGLVTASAGTAAAAEAAATGGASLAVAAPAIIGISTALGIAGLAAMWMWGGKKEASAADKKVQAATGVNLNGTDPAVALAKYKQTQQGRSEGKNGLVWFNGYQQFERPFMHSVKNQPLFGSHTTAPGTDRFGYRALGGAVARGASYIVGERGPELLTMGANNGFVTPNNRLGGMGGTTVIVNVAGSVIHEKDLAVTVRDNIAQLMRRRGLNPAILGV
jgi:flagellar basal body-associated protein FliL